MSNRSTTPRTSSAKRLPFILTLGIDTLLVVIFCIIGRLSHAEGILGDLPGLLNTIWPFLAALVTVHLIMLLRAIPAERMLPGAVLWILTVAGGFLLRAVSGQGTALPFLIVATLTLALLLLGWRVVLVLLRRTRRASVDAPR